MQSRRPAAHSIIVAVLVAGACRGTPASSSRSPTVVNAVKPGSDGGGLLVFADGNALRWMDVATGSTGAIDVGDPDLNWHGTVDVYPDDAVWIGGDHLTPALRIEREGTGVRTQRYDRPIFAAGDSAVVTTCQGALTCLARPSGNTFIDFKPLDSWVAAFAKDGTRLYTEQFDTELHVIRANLDGTWTDFGGYETDTVWFARDAAAFAFGFKDGIKVHEVADVNAQNLIQIGKVSHCWFTGKGGKALVCITHAHDDVYRLIAVHAPSRQVDPIADAVSAYVAISPDGDRIAYTARVDGEQRLTLLHLARGERDVVYTAAEVAPIGWIR